MNPDNTNITIDAGSETFTLPPDVIALYNKSITKTGLLILKVLAEHEGLQQKDLCDAVHTSKNSMSNLLSRMDSIRPKLLNATVSGRTKSYSLTSEARAYLQLQGHPAGRTNIYSFTDINSVEFIGKQAVESLQRLRCQLPQPWATSLHKILTGTASPADDSTSDACHDFIDKMVSLTLEGHPAALDRVYAAISNPILVDVIKGKINDTLGPDYLLLLPLYKLEKQDPQYALALINELISDMYPTIMQKCALTPKKVSDTEYYALFYAVSQMRNQFLQCISKEEAIKLWTNSYLKKSMIPQHLASTFELISQILK